MSKTQAFKKIDAFESKQIEITFLHLTIHKSRKELCDVGEYL